MHLHTYMHAHDKLVLQKLSFLYGMHYYNPTVQYIVCLNLLCIWSCSLTGNNNTNIGYSCLIRVTAGLQTRVHGNNTPQDCILCQCNNEIACYYIDVGVLYRNPKLWTTFFGINNGTFYPPFLDFCSKKSPNSTCSQVFYALIGTDAV